MLYIVLDVRFVAPFCSIQVHFIHIIWKYYIDTIVRYSFRRSYLFHGAIEDCAAEEIFMRHDILKDMNISYYAYMDINLAWSKMQQDWK